MTTEIENMYNLCNTAKKVLINNELMIKIVGNNFSLPYKTKRMNCQQMENCGTVYVSKHYSFFSLYI
jgi:hypothetical protein